MRTKQNHPIALLAWSGQLLRWALIGTLFATLLLNDPSYPLFAAVGSLFAPPESTESKSSEDEEGGEAAKAATHHGAIRRTARRRLDCLVAATESCLAHARHHCCCSPSPFGQHRLSPLPIRGGAGCTLRC